MRRILPQYLEPSPPLPPNLSFVLNLSPSAMTLGLGNMRRLLATLGNPERQFESVVIAGTNGKGSVSAYLSAILRANGKRVGWYCSPHVFSVNERIHVDGSPISIDAMEEAAARIVPLRKSIPYSYFEALTAIAFQAFAGGNVELAVLETGLGGRFDATNVVEPKVTILTGISLDHRRILGDSEEEILREKLGITRPGVPLVCGPLSKELRSIVEARALREGIRLFPFEESGSAELCEMTFESMRARVTTDRSDYGEVTLPLVGRHQLDNALLAIRAAELLVDRVGRLEESARSVALPGRFETYEIDGTRVVLDVAHNDASLTAATQTLAALSPREENGIILGVLRRKELLTYPQKLTRWVRRVHLIEPVVGEAYTAPQLVERLGLANFAHTGSDVFVEPLLANDRDWERFFDRLLSPSDPSRAILVTGSHRTVETFGRHFHSLGLF